MAGPVDRTAEAALWRRWRSAAAGRMAVAEPDTLTLAAWAEGRLSEREAEATEEWLAQHPEIWSDLAAARQGPQTVPAPAAVIARASALVEGGAEVLPFRRPAPRSGSWRVAVAWAGMAASLLVTSLVGFNLGIDTYRSIAVDMRADGVQDLLDPPIGLFNGVEEDAAT